MIVIAGKTADAAAVAASRSWTQRHSGAEKSSAPVLFPEAAPPLGVSPQLCSILQNDAAR